MSFYDSNTFKDKNFECKMATNLEKIFGELPSFQRSGIEKKGLVTIYAGDTADESIIIKKLNGTDIPYEVIVDGGLRRKYSKRSTKSQYRQRGTQSQAPESMPSLTCKEYDKSMTPDSFILYPGNEEAYMAFQDAFKNHSSGNQDPICATGFVGAGKTSILSAMMIQGITKGFFPGYMNLLKLKERDIKVNGGVIGLELDYFGRANLTAIDALEEIPLSKTAKWVRKLVYGYIEQGLSESGLQFLSFTGENKDYDEFVNKIPLAPLQDRLGKIEPIMINYPTADDHEIFVRKKLTESGVEFKSQRELEEIVEYLDSIIPKNQPISGREIQRYLVRIIAPAKRRGLMTLEGARAASTYQLDLLNPKTESPAEIYAGIIEKGGYNAKTISTPGGGPEAIKEKKEVIKSLLAEGISSSKQIGDLMNLSHSTIIYHMKKMNLK